MMSTLTETCADGSEMVNEKMGKMPESCQGSNRETSASRLQNA